MKKNYIFTLLMTLCLTGASFGQDLMITGLYDAGLTGGTPKGVELFVINDIADLSIYGIGSANNGGGTDGEEFTFPADAVTAGTFIYISTEVPNFNAFFGVDPDYTDSSMGINGDDAVELFMNGAVIDLFGDINTDGSGEDWDHLDGWAYRNNNESPSVTFNSADWTFSGINVFDGETTNATAASSFPIASYMNATASVKNNAIEGFATYPNPVTNKEFTISSRSTSVKEVAIFNLLGKQVLSSSFSGVKSNVDVSTISAGIYILKVTEEGKTATKKLVIK
jgi:hypothetical protein